MRSLLFVFSLAGFLILAGTTPAPEWAQGLGATIAALMFYLATRRPA